MRQYGTSTTSEWEDWFVADPSRERTVSVSTKLDTKFAQFGAAAELEQFLRASGHSRPRMVHAPPPLADVAAAY